MKRPADRPDCKIVRIETSKENPPRKRYICACGKAGPWDRDYQTWRNITADKAVQWNWKVHAGNIACHRARRERKEPMWNTVHVTRPVVTATPSPPPSSRFDSEYTVWDRLAKWLHEAEDLHGFCATNGIAVPSPLARFVDSYGTPPGRIPEGVKPGAIVEWEPEYASGTMRAVVTRIADGRVFVAIERRRPASARRRKPETEAWFEPDEVHRLRVVPVLGPHHCPVQGRLEGVPEVSSSIPADPASTNGSPITTAITVTSVEEPPRFELGNGGFADQLLG